MPKLAARMDKSKESAIIQIANKARKLKEEGRDIISFSIGVPNFLPAAHVKEAAHHEIEYDKGSYLPGRGTKELVEAFISRMSKNGFDYKPTEIVVGNGGKDILFKGLLAVLEEGDEVIFPAPYWSSYPDMVEFLGGDPVAVQASAAQNYKITAEQLEAAITDKTKVFLFNNPNNPTGMVYTEDEVRALGDVLVKHDIWIFSDDIYDRMIFDNLGFHHLLKTHPELKDRTLMMQSISKNYGMPGWRVGLGAASESMAKAIITLNGQSVTNVCGVAQAAATAAFAESQDFSDHARDDFEKKRDIVMDALTSIDGLQCPRPQGAFYAFPDVSFAFGKEFNGKVIKDATDICDLLLEAQNLACVPGEAFGEPKALRISYALPFDKLEEGLNRFKAFFTELS